jgi:hypothetical protein
MAKNTQKTQTGNKNKTDKANGSKTNKVQLLNNPALKACAVYFSVYLESEEEYYNFISQDSHEKNLQLCHALIQSREIPKYFHVMTLDTVYDLKALKAKMTMELFEEDDNTVNMQVTRKEYDEEDNHLIELSYADYLAEHFESSAFAQNMSQEIASRGVTASKPVVIQSSNQVDIVDDYFCLDYEGESDYELTPFDYHFPQKCVFAVPFLILGNEKPLEKFIEKMDNLELDDFPWLLGEIYGEEVEDIEMLGFDALEQANIYNIELVQADFEYEVEQVLQEQKDSIVHFDDFPVFIHFEAKKQGRKTVNEVKIRLPFLTFDMYAQNVLLPENTEFVEMLFHSHVMRRLMVSDVLANLGLDYEYVVASRIDFVHEPEMQASVINKVMSREAISGNIYYEESAHHTDGHAEDAKLTTMVQVHIADYPFIIMTVQDEENIVRQVNAYMIELHDAQDDLEEIAGYFNTYGGEELEHVVIEGNHHMHYCEEHLKVSGLVI